MSDQRVAALQQYMVSLAPGNPTWRHHKQQHEAQHQDSFSGRLQQEYSSSRRPEVQRSLDICEEPRDVDCCATVTLRVNSEYGRHLVASRDIRAGEELFREVPVVLTPRLSPDPACLACLRGLWKNWRGCDKCGAPLCWPRCSGALHGVEECQMLAALVLNLGPESEKDSGRMQLLNEMLTPLRTLLVLADVPALRGVVAALQSNLGLRRRLRVGQDTAVRVAEALHEDKDVVAHILGVFDTNAFVVGGGSSSEGGLGGVGRALVPLTALMNHTCTANTQHWFHQGAIIVRAVCDIPRDTEVTTSYAPTLWGNSARAAHLTASKLFRCRCVRCRDPTELGSHLSSLVCRACVGLMAPPPTPAASWVCGQCGAEVGWGAAEAVVRGAGGIVRLVGEGTDVATLTAATTHLTRILGHTHYVTREATYALLLAILTPPLPVVSEGDLLRAVAVSRDLLGVADLVDPGLSRFRGVLLLELARASAELLRRRSSESAADLTATTIKTAVDAIIANDTVVVTTNITTPSDTNTAPTAATMDTDIAISNDASATSSSYNVTDATITNKATNSVNTTNVIITNAIKDTSTISTTDPETTNTTIPHATISNTSDKLKDESDSFARNEDSNTLQHNGYNLNTIEKLQEVAEESEVILQFDSRLLDVLTLKQQLQDLQRQLCLTPGF